MKKTMKKIIATFLVVAIILCSAPLSGLVGLELPDWLDFSIKSSAETLSGTCGDNLTWTFDDSTGTLTISGMGEMEDYQRHMAVPLYSIPPWESYWNNIISIVIDEGITYIGEETFVGYANLTSITIPDSVTAIGGKAFYDCTSLTSITLPDSVTEFSSNVFYNTAYYNDESNWENGVLYIDNHLIKCKQDFSGSCVIKDGTKTIAMYAFKDCTSLTSITIPDSLTIISPRAFVNCVSLSRLGIPDNVKKIGYCAFYNCMSLTDIGISGGVTDISSGAFLKCILRYVFYTGTEEQWKSLKVSGSDAMLNASRIHYNCSKVVTLPTCTEQGYTTFSCHDCEISQPQSLNSIVRNYTDATGHTYVDTVTPPTCTEQGCTTYTCRCGDTYTSDETTSLGHTEVMDNAVAPTCTETGLSEGKHCSVCNEVLVEQTVVDALGHTANAPVVENVKDATCTENGGYDEVVYCSVCDEELSRETKTVDALGHTPKAPVVENVKDATCTENGGYDEVVYCSVCDEELSRETITVDALGHTDNNDDGICDTCNEQFCSCRCHRTGIVKFFWQIINFVQKLFGNNKVCACGKAH